jgi:hypothetical protein
MGLTCHGYTGANPAGDVVAPLDPPEKNVITLQTE